MPIFINGVEQATYTDAEAIAAVEGEATLDLAGDVDVATGKTLSADGLKFPATQVASGDVNTFDDYEEGTFTPEIADDSLDGSGESQAYSIQTGRYVKWGNHVLVQFDVATTSIGSLTGGHLVRVVGFPFTSHADNNSAGAAGFGSGLAITAGNCPQLLVGGDSALTTIREWSGTAGVSDLTITEWSANGRIVGTVAYEV